MNIFYFDQGLSMYLSPHCAFFCYALMLILVDKVKANKYQ